MDADSYKEAIEYELLTQAIYKTILANDGVNTVKVRHNVSLTGHSGVEHQVDVYWDFKQAGITHRVLIECKNYASNLTLEKARNFFAVVHDVGNCAGIMVTKTGYQSGAAAFCKYYGLTPKLLRKPDEKDWEGRVKTIHINMIPRVPVSNKQHPIVCTLAFRPNSQAQEARLKQAASITPNFVQASPFMRFLGKDGEP
ncbi:MAG: restriction endonuclease, partial [Methylocella sp.]